MIFPRPTNRAVIDVGHSCNLRCTMCYHAHEMKSGKASYRNTEELKGEIFKAQQRGNNYVDFTGGCVELHPGIFELITHCTTLNMKCCIITTGIMGDKLSGKLIDSDIDDFLVSIHHDNMRLKDGSQFNAKERQESFLSELNKANKTYRFNCVMAKSTQHKLIGLSNWATKWKPRIFNFINVNPHHEWRNDVEGTKKIIADIDVLEEQLCEAIPILLDAGIGVNVRYYPMCRLPEAFRRHVCNDLQVLWDCYEWDYGITPKIFKAYYDAGMNMSKNTEWKGQPCLKCDLKFICGGINAAFYRADGRRDIIKPVKLEGVQRDDFYHYRRFNDACLVDRYHKEDLKCIATIADDSNVGYIPVFIRDVMENKPDCDFRVLSLCTDHEEVRKLTDQYIGYGIFDNCILDVKTKAMEFKEENKIMRIRDWFYLNSPYPIIEHCNIEESKIIPDKKVHEMYRQCGFIDNRIEKAYLDMVGTPLNPPASAVVKPKPKEKSPQFEHYEGYLLIFTVCDENYQWYAPMFIKSINTTMPEHFVKVLVLGKCNDDMLKLCNQNCINYNIEQYVGNLTPNGQYFTSAYRFLVKPRTDKEYPYCLITDIDMLMYKERYSIIDTHMEHLKRDGTECYENYISEYRGGEPRLPGVLFVTKEWWEKTELVREVELKKLVDDGANEYYYDEMMLGRIVSDSGLNLPSSKAKLWRHHGVHIGDWRLNMARKTVVHQNVFQKMHIDAMLKSEEFMDIVGECSKYIDIMEKVLKAWKQLLK